MVGDRLWKNCPQLVKSVGGLAYPLQRLSEKQQQGLMTLCQENQPLAQAYKLAQALVAMLHNRQAGELSQWLSTA